MRREEAETLVNTFLTTYIDAFSGGPDAAAAQRQHDTVRQTLIGALSAGRPKPPDASPYEWRNALVQAKVCVRGHNNTIPSHWLEVMFELPELPKAEIPPPVIIWEDEMGESIGRDESGEVVARINFKQTSDWSGEWVVKLTPPLDWSAYTADGYARKHHHFSALSVAKTAVIDLLYERAKKSL